MFRSSKYELKGELHWFTWGESVTGVVIIRTHKIINDFFRDTYF